MMMHHRSCIVIRSSITLRITVEISTQITIAQETFRRRMRHCIILTACAQPTPHIAISPSHLWRATLVTQMLGCYSRAAPEQPLWAFWPPTTLSRTSTRGNYLTMHLICDTNWSPVAIKLVLMIDVMTCHSRRYFPIVMPLISPRHPTIFGDTLIVKFHCRDETQWQTHQSWVVVRLAHSIMPRWLPFTLPLGAVPKSL